MGKLDESGFLSPEVQTWIFKHRATYSGWFTLCESLNRLVQSVMLTLEPPKHDERRVIVLLLLSRALSHFQGIVLLTERGMVSEARSLLRGMLDTTFAAVALAKHPELVKPFVQDDIYQRSKVASMLMSKPKTFRRKHGLGMKKLQGIAGELKEQMKREKIQPLTSEFLAQKSDLMDLYMLFVVLSSSTHSRVRDMERHLEVAEDESISGLKWGPDVGDLDHILAPACEVMFQCVKAVNVLFDYRAPETQFQEQWEIFKALVAGMDEGRAAKG